jgi:hypothetical protein
MPDKDSYPKITGEIRPVQRSGPLGALSDAARWIENASAGRPLPEFMSDALAVPSIATTLDRMSYGEPLTSGTKWQRRMLPETAEMAMNFGPGAAAAGVRAGKLAGAVGRRANRMFDDAIDAGMDPRIEAAARRAREINKRYKHISPNFDNIELPYGQGFADGGLVQMIDGFNAPDDPVRLANGGPVTLGLREAQIRRAMGDYPNDPARPRAETPAMSQRDFSYPRHRPRPARDLLPPGLLLQLIQEIEAESGEAEYGDGTTNQAPR